MFSSGRLKEGFIRGLEERLGPGNVFMASWCGNSESKVSVWKEISKSLFTDGSITSLEVRSDSKFAEETKFAVSLISFFGENPKIFGLLESDFTLFSIDCKTDRVSMVEILGGSDRGAP